ncbi:MFS transporter [Clostridium acetobutylicum]|nr:MFS transporter [Clostridium acetobutylicum]
MRLTRIVNILYLVQCVHISIVQFTLLQSIFSITQFVMEVPSGMLGDFFKKKNITTYGLILSATAQLLICSRLVVNAENPFVILAFAFAIEGIGRALISGADDALFYENIRADGYAAEYDKIRGRYQLISSISVGIVTSLGTILYTINNSIPYIGQCIMTIISIGSIMTVKEHNVKKTLRKNENGKNSIKVFLTSILQVRNSPHIVFMMCLVCLTFGVINTVFGIMPDYISEIGFSNTQTGTVFMLLSFIGGIVATQAYRISNKRYGQLVLVTVLCMSSGVSLVGLRGNKEMIFIGLALLYVIIDVLDPIAMKSFNAYVDDSIRSTFLSMVSFMVSTSTMILYPIAGIIVEAFGMLTLLIAISAVVIPLLGVSCIIYKKYSVN